MFSELYNLKKDSAKEQQCNARIMFPKIVKHSTNFKLYTSDIRTKISSYIIIGVSTFSIYDMIFLDEIDVIISPYSHKNIYVYDLLEVKDITELNIIFHNIGNIYQTPILAKYDNYIVSDIVIGFKIKAVIKKIINS